MTQLNIAIPPALHEWLSFRVAEGRYADEADYIRDLVRRDQEASFDDTASLQALIDEGLASGMIDKDPELVLDEIIAERRAFGG